MRFPRLVEAWPASPVERCECCDRSAALKVLIEYGNNVGEQDFFNVCMEHCKMARQANFDTFFQDYEHTLRFRKPEEETWTDQKPLLSDDLRG